MRFRPQLPITLLAAALLALPAMAHPPREEGGPGEPYGLGPRAARMAEHLELSDGQRQELEELMAERHAAGADSWRALAAARRALADQVRAESFDEAAIRAAAAELAALEADLAVARARHAQRLREILTPEQLERFEELQELRAERRGPRGHRRHPRHGRFGPRAPAQP